MSMTMKRNSPDETTTITTDDVVVAACPYAQAMMTMRGCNNSNATDPSSSSSSAAATTTDDGEEVASIAVHPLPSSLPGVIELQECPAFRNKTCPFKDAKSPQEISHKLSQIPSSHWQKGTTHNSVLLQTLAYYHTSRNNNNNNISGDTVNTTSCPVKGLVPKDWTFDRAMEDYSLASIMSRLAEEHECTNQEIVVVEEADNNKILENDHHNRQDEDLDDNNSHRDENQSTVTSSSLETLGSLAPPSSSSSIFQKDNPTTGRPLSEALKTGTAAAHEAAESVHFVKNFIRGKIDRDLYGLLIAQLYHVYQRLERLLDEYAPIYFAECHFPRELQRLPALKEDVDFWLSTKDDTSSSMEPVISPTTQDYLDRLDLLAKENPLLLLAHAYTRYLGDLSGGKVLGRVARRALNLDKDGEGLAFYHFPHVESAKKFKDQYRQCLNELPLNDKHIQALVQEANIAFLLNMRLFEELDVLGGVPGATIRDLSKVYDAAAAAAVIHSETNENSMQCPFAKDNAAAIRTTSTITKKKHGTCPWPFILLHDPITGLKHHETWLTIVSVVVVAFLYNKYGV
jgi:heme oxygenase